MIIAVDFDGTLCRECYPEIGGANITLIENSLKEKEMVTNLFFGLAEKTLY